MSIGVFDVATAGDDEQRIQKQAAADKLNAAIYDVREKFGSWLFGAGDLDGFNDRAKLAYVEICKAIEPHLHARTGVHRRVMKTMESEWRQRKADVSEDSLGENIDSAVSNAVPGAAKQPKMPRQHVHGPQLEGRRRQADGPSVQDDPERAHAIFDRANELVDERAQPALDPAFDQGFQQPAPDPGFDANVGAPTGDSLGAMPPGPEDHFIARKLACYPGCDKDEAHSKKFHKGEDKEARRYFAEFETEHDHPELNTDVTFKDHQGDKLEPEGDFDAYKDRVDQGGPEKVDNHAFTGPDSRSSSPYEVKEHNESGDHNFVPTVTGARQMSEYQRIARMIQADAMGAPAPSMAPPTAAGNAPEQPAGAPGGIPGAGGATPPATPAATPDITSTPPAGLTAARSEYYTIQGMLHESARGTGHRWASKAIIQDGTRVARQRLIAVCRDRGVLRAKQANNLIAAIKTADSNYLQKADEALTKVLNEKAEEFQNTIAPLQQALITIQQAEQLANPMNVNPPAGTINVMPGQGQPAAAAPPQLGADPAAAGLAGQPAAQPQQAVAKRGGSPKG
jgi:hypothetical protein